MKKKHALVGISNRIAAGVGISAALGGLWLGSYLWEGPGIALGADANAKAPTTQLIIPEVDDQVAPALKGAIGVGTWDTTAEFKDIRVVASDGTELLKAAFDKGPKGIDGWQSSIGQWSGADGVLTQKSRSTNCLLTWKEKSWTDYTYTLKARRTGGTEGFIIAFALQTNNFYWWNIGGWGNTRTAVQKTGQTGKNDIPGTAVDLRVEDDKWHDIKIALHGATADCYFDGKLITRINNDKGFSSMPDAGPPTVLNDGKGPVPARPPAGAAAARYSEKNGPTTPSTDPVKWGKREDMANEFLDFETARLALIQCIDALSEPRLKEALPLLMAPPIRNPLPTSPNALAETTITVRITPFWIDLRDKTWMANFGNPIAGTLSFNGEFYKDENGRWAARLVSKGQGMS